MPYKGRNYVEKKKYMISHKLYGYWYISCVCVVIVFDCNDTYCSVSSDNKPFDCMHFVGEEQQINVTNQRRHFLWQYRTQRQKNFRFELVFSQAFENAYSLKNSFPLIT